MSTIVQTEYPSVVRTSHGLSIAGIRITLYDILDYLKAGWTPRLIQELLDLTESQIGDAMQYIEHHRAEVDAEYQEIVKRAEENRAYWKAREQEHLAQRRKNPVQLTPEQIALREKFEAWRSKREAEIRDEMRWNELFEETPEQLVAAAKRARQQIAESMSKSY